MPGDCLWSSKEGHRLKYELIKLASYSPGELKSNRNG